MFEIFLRFAKWWEIYSNYFLLKIASHNDTRRHTHMKCVAFYLTRLLYIRALIVRANLIILILCVRAVHSGYVKIVAAKQRLYDVNLTIIRTKKANNQIDWFSYLYFVLVCMRPCMRELTSQSIFKKLFYALIPNTQKSDVISSELEFNNKMHSKTKVCENSFTLR